MVFIAENALLSLRARAFRNSLAQLPATRKAMPLEANTAEEKPLRVDELIERLRACPPGATVRNSAGNGLVVVEPGHTYIVLLFRGD